MKNKLFLILAAAIMAACSTPDIPAPIKNAKADFTYRVFDENYPLTITFTNTSSSGLNVYLWEMGDGKSYAGGETITYSYSKAGTYDVTLVCKDVNRYTYETIKTITIAGDGTIRGDEGSTTDPGTQNPGTQECYAMFSVERVSPLMIECVNTSKNAASYLWEFGDDTYAYGKDAIHTYETTGTYTIKLTIRGTDDKYYETHQTIKLTEPRAYVDGYVIYSIPYENKYYHFVFKDDNLLPSSWDWNTAYTPLLTSADLPYSYTMNTKKEFTNPNTHDYWTIDLRRANSSSGANETSCLKGKFRLSDLKQYKPEYIWTSESGTTSFGIRMLYEY